MKKLELFKNLVHRRVVTEIARERGVSRAEAHEIAKEKFDHAWTQATATNEFTAPMGVGDGKILQWIIDHEDQIVALVTMIVKIILAFGDQNDNPKF